MQDICGLLNYESRWKLQRDFSLLYLFSMCSSTLCFCSFLLHSDTMFGSERWLRWILCLIKLWWSVLRLPCQHCIHSVPHYLEILFGNFSEPISRTVSHSDVEACCSRSLYGFLPLTGQTEEPPSALSSPILDTPLDSPLSCADLTLDSTGELTVEDVRDFLT